MATPSGLVGPIIGAIISGFVGIIVVEYRNYRDKVTETKHWYDHAIQLADQIERETPDSYLENIRGEGEANERAEVADDMVEAYGRIGEQLSDHVNRAPSNIEAPVIDAATETAKRCRIVAREGRDSGFLSRVGPAIDNAETLRERANKAKWDVGLF